MSHTYRYFIFSGKVALLTFAFVLSSSISSFADPTGRVGRLSYMEGTVSFRPAAQDQWSLATPNYPVVSGDAFWTEPGARTEIQVGSIEVRMDQSTEMDVVQLDDGHTSISIPQGVVNIHLRATPLGGAMQVMTPAGQIDLVEPGSYHIDSGQSLNNVPSSQVQVTALEGEAQIRTPRSLLEVMPGETAILTGNPPAYMLEEGEATPFDNWALARERREVASQSLHYVSPYMTGYEDLDHYGAWSTAPQYGAIWYPATVTPEWAPYRYGHWAFVQPWGWTWIDDAPWGFAPFHYGRWVCIDHRWGWVPGAIVERPVYAPALVAFIGGAHWSLSFSAGSAPAVGWVPLAPHEVFHPYYPASVQYVKNINITHVNNTVINNITVNNVQNVTVKNYVNQQAVTVVPASAFTKAAPVHKAALIVKQEQLKQAPIIAAPAHLQPAPVALSGGKPLPGGTHLPPQHATASPMRQVAPGSVTVAPAVPHPMQPEMRNNKPEEWHHDVHNQEKTISAAPVPHPIEMPNARITPMQEPVKQRKMEEAPSPAIQAPRPHDAERAPAPHIEKHPEPIHRDAMETLPKADVHHPVQKMPIIATPQGWQRMPAQHLPPAMQNRPVHEEDRMHGKEEQGKVQNEKRDRP